MSTAVREQTVTATTATQRYTAAWRWYFFAGIVVIPFLLVRVTAGNGARTTPMQQLAAAQDALPGGTAVVYIPPSAPDLSAQFEFTRADTPYAVDVDPYTNGALRVVDKDSTLYALAHHIHGTLLLGEIGDTVVEVVA